METASTSSSTRTGPSSASTADEEIHRAAAGPTARAPRLRWTPTCRRPAWVSPILLQASWGRIEAAGPDRLIRGPSDATRHCPDGIRHDIDDSRTYSHYHMSTDTLHPSHTQTHAVSICQTFHTRVHAIRPKTVYAFSEFTIGHLFHWILSLSFGIMRLQSHRRQKKSGLRWCGTYICVSGDEMLQFSDSSWNILHVSLMKPYL